MAQIKAIEKIIEKYKLGLYFYNDELVIIRGLNIFLNKILKYLTLKMVHTFEYEITNLEDPNFSQIFPDLESMETYLKKLGFKNRQELDNIKIFVIINSKIIKINKKDLNEEPFNFDTWEEQIEKSGICKTLKPILLKDCYISKTTLYTKYLETDLTKSIFSKKLKKEVDDIKLILFTNKEKEK